MCEVHETGRNKKTSASLLRFFSLGYQDSNLEMTESESVALPFGDSPIYATRVIIAQTALKYKCFFAEVIYKNSVTNLQN